MPSDDARDLAAIRQRLYQATNCSTDLTTVIPADLFTYLQAMDAQAARLAAVEQALETIRDYDALDTPIRPGPCSIGDMSLAISRGLDYCQRVASAALKETADGQ
jgi:hypothetical protein